MKHRAIVVCALAAAFSASGILAALNQAADWPMWAGTPGRNLVSAMTGAPDSWDAKKGQNIKWKAKLGSQTYGNPVIAGGQVYIGTNNAATRNPKEPGDRGVLKCFREADGAFLWQHTHERLQADHLDWPETGVCSTPVVEGNRLYYISNRGEVVALDTRGDGNGGSKLLWSYDMVKELGIVPLFKISSSPVILGDLVYATTSNGTDENRETTPNPTAPPLIALGKHTGKLVWKARDGATKLYEGQWASPSAGTIGGVAQVVLGEGDGWVRGYAAGEGNKLWEFNTNPKGSVWPRTAGVALATPVIWENKVYVANGQDPENGQGPGNLYAIDATKRGDISASGLVWRNGEIKRSISTVAIHNGLLFAADVSGFLYCLDVATGKAHWAHDLLAGIWASPMVIGEKVYLSSADGDIVVLEASAQKNLLFQTNMGASIYSTLVPANGALYVATTDTLFALAKQ